MTPKTRLLLKKYGGYTAFFLASFVFMLYATFPYSALGDMAKVQAKKAGIDLDIGSIGPGFFSLRASDIAVRLSSKSSSATPVPIDSLSVRPTLFPPGVAFSAKAFGGSASGDVVGIFGTKPKVSFRAKALNLQKANLRDAVGLDLSGKLNSAIVDLKMDVADASKTAGRLALNVDELVVHGGSVAHWDLPKVQIGRLDADIQVEAGKANLKTVKAQGTDVDASADGSITLAQKLMLSTLDVQLKFKPAEAFLAKNEFVKTGLAFSGMTKDGRGFYAGKLSRMLGNPRFAPVRQ